MTVDAVPSALGARDSVPPATTFRGLIASHAREITIGALLLAATNVTSALVPQFTRGASNAILASQQHTGMMYAAGIVVAAVLGAASRVGSRMALFNSGRNIEYELRAALLARLHVLGPSFYRRMSSGEVMSRATNDLAQVRLMVGFAALNMFNVVFAYVANIPVMLYRSPLLTLSALAPFPLFLLLTRAFAGSMFVRSRATQETLGAMSDRLQRTLAGIRVVRAYGLEAHETDAFDTISARSLEANLSLARLRGGLMPILGAATAVGALVVLWVGGRMVVAHRATVGDILAFQGHLALVGWPTIALGYVFSILDRGRASLVRIDEVLRAEPDVTDRGAVPLDHVEGRLSVRDLSWTIETRAVLDHVSFDVPAGESLAIVGRTGSGKSILAQLVARMLPTPAGTVMLDGRDITTLPIAQLRGAVCLAQQEAFLFSTTIERNIAFAAPDREADAAYARALDVADEVQLRGELETMPDGLDTIVGERGVQLSGGQKQRVALARALLAAPHVLVLDDPLSAVDARTESAILDAIERAAKGRTLVLVTHRITAAARCQHVLVLDEGRVIEHGTHAELIDRGGAYARLAERQQLEAELEAIA